MNIRNLKKQIYNTKSKTRFFELLNTTILDQDIAISVFNQRSDFVIRFVGTMTKICQSQQLHRYEMRQYLKFRGKSEFKKKN